MGDIILIASQKIALNFVCFPEIFGIDKMLYYFWHPADGHVFTEELHHLLMNCYRNMFSLLIISFQMLQHIRRNVPRPEKLFKIKRMELQIIYISDGIRRGAFVVNA